MFLAVSGRPGWVTRTAFDRKRGIQFTFTTSLEGLDFANDLALLSHKIQDMRDKTWALEVQGAKIGLKINATIRQSCSVLDPNVGMVSRSQWIGLRKWMSSL